MTPLDGIALSIELVLISVVEAVALTFLAESAIPLMHDTSQLMYLPYIISGLILILVFWSQSILHAVSFIRWPLRLPHMFLYFVAAFIQVVAYSNLTDPVRWFFWMSIFSVVAVILYVIDSGVITDSRRVFMVHTHGGDFMDEVERRHRYEMRILVPIALLFNVMALSILLVLPETFSHDTPRAILGVVSAVVSLGALVDCTRNFSSRSVLIKRLLEE